MATRLELRRALREAALRFVDEVMAIIDQHPPGTTGGGAVVGPARASKRGRRTVETLQALGDRIVAVVAERPGISIGEIGRRLGHAPSELTRPIALLLSEGKLAKRGERRGTRYALPGQEGAAKARKQRAAARVPAKRTAKR